MITIDTQASAISEQVERCRLAQRSWAEKPIRERLRFVKRFRHLIVQECNGLCAAVARDLGKPFEETLAGELLPLAAACKYLEHQASTVLRPRRVPLRLTPLWLLGQSDRVYRRPRGVVGIIGTWNYPLFLSGVQMIQALAAGNAVLWKPSEVTPSSADALFGLATRAGFPSGLIERLPATREAGPQLANADVDHVVFTGSSATGRRLAETLGKRLITSTMELSGLDALYVFADANVPLAAKAAWFGATINRGQTCIASRRVVVQRAVYQPFIEALKPLAAGAAPQPLALEAQARQAERLVQEAIADGASLLDAGAETLPGENGNTCRPTIVVDAQANMSICREASFAPLVAVLPFEDEADLLRIDAACTYGLGVGVFTASPARARRLASHLRAGMVTVNDVVIPTAHPATPFGGIGESGWGSTQGDEGLLEMTVPQVVSVRGGSFRPHYGAAVGKPPMSPEAFRGLLQYSHGETLGQRLAGLWHVIRGR
jgi:acyl-CoA reductase-like NAD-dependent aldehyde dehydrogenase